MQKLKLAIIGHPLSHSLSKVIHEAAMKDLGIEGSYDVLDTLPEDLIHRIKRLKVEGYHGFNVTIPHKVPITLFLTQFDSNVNMISSVNTVKISEDKNLEGYNTDIYGFVEPIPLEVKSNLKGKIATVLGTGGASRAIAAGLVSLGVSKIIFYSRNIIDSHNQVEILRNKFKNVKIELKPYSLFEDCKGSKILVNATPLGMKNFAVGKSPISKQEVEALDDDCLIYDIVYNPVNTTLIEYAKECNKKYLGGLDMLIYQAIMAFEIFSGKKPDFDKLKIAALEALV